MDNMDNEEYPNVSVIIINWNGWRDTIECLESLYQINYPNFEVIVVDNNSQDESVEEIRDYASGKIEVKSEFFEYNSLNKPLRIIEYTKNEFESVKQTVNSTSKSLVLIKNHENYGFAEGNNIGIKYALDKLNSDYILLLNNDTVVDKDFLKELVNTGKSNENIGIIGPKIYYYNEPNVIWCIGGKIDWKFARGLHAGTNEADTGQYNKIKEFDYISGSAFLIKKEVLEKAGLMDEKFFLYFEETDLALRASKEGYKSVFVPEAKIWHKVSKSGGGITKPIGLYYITRNRWLFMKKWAKKSDYIFFVLYQAVGAIVLPILLSVYYRNGSLFKAYYNGLLNGAFK
ncbi:glycosyltransferase family 2 protein [Methanobacterium sp.]|uniref:glycosyltransferase family 2 protein n=1 Tax=Methanobacterium sp. TaxID=2164 RepID=UPI003C77233B